MTAAYCAASLGFSSPGSAALAAGHTCPSTYCLRIDSGEHNDSFFAAPRLAKLPRAQTSLTIYGILLTLIAVVHPASNRRPQKLHPDQVVSTVAEDTT